MASPSQVVENIEYHPIPHLVDHLPPSRDPLPLNISDLITNKHDRHKSSAQLEDEVRYRDLIKESGKLSNGNDGKTSDIPTELAEILPQPQKSHFEERDQRVFSNKIHELHLKPPGSIEAHWFMSAVLLHRERIESAMTLANYIEIHSGLYVGNFKKADALRLNTSALAKCVQFKAAKLSTAQLQTDCKLNAYISPLSYDSIQDSKQQLSIWSQVSKFDQAIELASETLQIVSLPFHSDDSEILQK